MKKKLILIVAAIFVAVMGVVTYDSDLLDGTGVKTREVTLTPADERKSEYAAADLSSVTESLIPGPRMRTQTTTQLLAADGEHTYVLDPSAVVGVQSPNVIVNPAGNGEAIPLEDTAGPSGPQQATTPTVGEPSAGSPSGIAPAFLPEDAMDGDDIVGIVPVDSIDLLDPGALVPDLPSGSPLFDAYVPQETPGQAQPPSGQTAGPDGSQPNLGGAPGTKQGEPAKLPTDQTPRQRKAPPGITMAVNANAVAEPPAMLLSLLGLAVLGLVRRRSGVSRHC